MEGYYKEAYPHKTVKLSTKVYIFLKNHAYPQGDFYRKMAYPQKKARHMPGNQLPNSFFISSILPSWKSFMMRGYLYSSKST